MRDLLDGLGSVALFAVLLVIVPAAVVTEFTGGGARAFNAAAMGIVASTGIVFIVAKVTNWVYEGLYQRSRHVLVKWHVKRCEFCGEFHTCKPKDDDVPGGHGGTA